MLRCGRGARENPHIMTFNWPWMLAALVPTVLVACWVLWRPARRIAAVAALSLWRDALESLAYKGHRRRRRVLAQWVCLLCGGAAVVLAMARPVVYRTSPQRRVTLIVYPSAELAGDDGRDLRRAADRLLGRLSAADRVRLALPDVLGGDTDWLTPADTRESIDRLPILPARAADLSVSIPPTENGRTIILAPAGLGATRGGDDSLIELPTSLPPVTIDRVAAVLLPDGSAQVFVAVRNQTPQPMVATTHVRMLNSELAQVADSSGAVGMSLGGRGATTLTLPVAGEVAVVSVSTGAAETPSDFAYLVRRPMTLRKVAMIGADDPMVRRYIASDNSTELVADPTAADIVIANGTSASRLRPSLVFNAAAVQPFRDAIVLRQFALLAEADVDVSHPVMAGVRLADVAVRQLPLWPRPASSQLAVLAGMDGKAFIVAADTDRTTATGARAIYVLPDIAPANTNWSMTESFAYFMANSTRWLSPGEAAAEEYLFRAPRNVGRPPDWQPLAVAGSGRRWRAGPLLPPGVYAGPDDSRYALSLVGMISAAPTISVDDAVDTAPLGEAKDADVAFDAWPVLAAVGAGLWLAGWTLRVVR